MDYYEMDKLASERAAHRAPKPKYEPMIAGMTGVLVTQGVVITFINIAGLSTEDFTQAMSVTALIGFLAPFLWIRSEEKRYFKAYSEEMEELKRSAAQNAEQSAV